MTTPVRRRAQAEEAERLARMVSYGRDRERLLRQAQDHRAEADALEAAPPHEVEPQPAVASRLRRWLGLR